MIELYDVNDINFSSNLSFDSMLKKSFLFAVIILAIFIVISLIIWLVGAKIKSENAIKFGIRSFIIAAIMQVLVISIPILINFANSKI